MQQECVELGNDIMGWECCMLSMDNFDGGSAGVVGGMGGWK